MGLGDFIFQEIMNAQVELREVVWIRVTPDALEGSPVTVPVTPERARTIKLSAYEGATYYETQDGKRVQITVGAGVDASPEMILRAPLEIIIHPADWYRLLVEMPAWYFQFGPMSPDGVDRVLGKPVKKD